MRLNRRYWAALGLIAALMILHQLLLQPALGRLTSDAPVLNVSGRQRMLSQKLAKAALAFEASTTDADRLARRTELEDVLAEWKRAHRGLQSGSTELRLPGRNPPRIVTAFEDLDPHFQSILTAAEDLLAVRSSHGPGDAPSPAEHAAVQRILEHESEFLSRMHALVGLYEMQARDRIARLQQTGFIIMVTILGVLAAVQLGVVQPMVNLVSREFAQSEEQYRRLVESMNDGLLVQDLQGRVLYANQRFGEMVGHAATELPGKPCSIFVADCDRRRYDQMHLTADEDSETIEIALQHANGQVVDVMASPRPWRDLDGNRLGCLLVVTDITARRRAEQRTRELQDQLAHADRLKSMGELAAGVAHEINQPLCAIALYAEGCLAQLAGPNPDINQLREPLQRMLQAALRGGEIIRRARRFSQLRPHTVAPERINDLCEEVEQLCLPEARRRAIDMHCALAKELPSIVVDGVQIQQVLTNLIQNAMFALEETPVYRRRISIQTSLIPDEAIEIAVADTGPGVPADAQQRIFEPFVTSRKEGTGMGLAIARGIVESHGGQIWVEQNSDGGATFRFRLPLGSPHIESPPAIVVPSALSSETSSAPGDLSHV